MNEMRMKPVWVGMMMAVAAMGQTAPSKEYIYLNGRLLAVETTTANAGPTVTSVTPASGSGGSGTYTAVYSDGNGASDIAKGELQVLPTGGTAANGCVARYVKGTGLLELLNDAGTAAAGTVTPGGTGSVSNSRCTLNAAGSSATASGQTLTVVFPLVYAAAFAGAKDLKLYAADAAGLTAGPTAMGAWTVPDTAAPVISGAGATAGDTTATITWTTDEGASSQVEYGTTTAYGSSSPLDATLATSHTVSLTGLQMATLYYLRLQSKDAAGNAATPVLLQLTTTAPACTLTPVSGMVANAGGSVAVTVNCAAGRPWTSAVNGGVTWASVTPASGTGPGTATVTAANAGGAAQRTATATIAGQTFTLTQRGASTVSLTPASASAAHDQTVPFNAVVDGVSSNCTVTWTLTPVVGTISNCGVYVAPSVILSTQTAVTVTATDPVNSGSASAALTLAPYAPPGALSVSPSSGTAVSTTLTFAVTDAGGAASVTDVQMLIHTTNGDAVNACYVRVRPGNVEMPENAMYLGVNSGTGWYGPTGAGTAGAVLSNSQCSLNVASSTVAMAGNTVSIAIPVTFKPGFTGVKNIYMKATNSSGASTYWTQVGTRDLTGNAPAMAPWLSVATPTAGATVSGTVNVTGAALDNATQVENDITSVEIYIDNVFKGYATLGQSSTACTMYPGRPGCPNVGFTYALNTGLLTNGTHTLKVVAWDFDTVPKPAETSYAITVNNVVPLAVVVSPGNTYVRMLYNDGLTPVDTRQFSATVGGAPSTAVDWSVWVAPPNNSGSITTAGLYMPPNVSNTSLGTNVTVTAVRQANPSDTGTATATMMGLMSPTIVALTAGQSTLFSTTLGSVTFSVSPSLGTVGGTGYYTAPGAGTFTSGTYVTVTATSTANPTMRQQSVVKLQ